MKPVARWLIYIVAALALVAGSVAAYLLSEEQHEHEDEGLVEGDSLKVAVMGGALAVVAGVSFVYLARKPPEEAK